MSIFDDLSDWVNECKDDFDRWCRKNNASYQRERYYDECRAHQKTKEELAYARNLILHLENDRDYWRGKYESIVARIGDPKQYEDKIHKAFEKLVAIDSSLEEMTGNKTLTAREKSIVIFDLIDRYSELNDNESFELKMLKSRVSMMSEELKTAIAELDQYRNLLNKDTFDLIHKNVIFDTNIWIENDIEVVKAYVEKIESAGSIFHVPFHVKGEIENIATDARRKEYKRINALAALEYIDSKGFNVIPTIGPRNPRFKVFKKDYGGRMHDYIIEDGIAGYFAKTLTWDNGVTLVSNDGEVGTHLFKRVKAVLKRKVGVDIEIEDILKVYGNLNERQFKNCLNKVS